MGDRWVWFDGLRVGYLLCVCYCGTSPASSEFLPNSSSNLIDYSLQLYVRHFRAHANRALDFIPPEPRDATQPFPDITPGKCYYECKQEEKVPHEQHRILGHLLRRVHQQALDHAKYRR